MQMISPRQVKINIQDNERWSVGNRRARVRVSCVRPRGLRALYRKLHNPTIRVTLPARYQPRNDVTLKLRALDYDTRMGLVILQGYGRSVCVYAFIETPML